MTAIPALLDQVRQHALSYENVEEYFPWRDRSFKIKNGRIFLSASDHDDHLSITVRLSLGEREYGLELPFREQALELPFVEVARYIGYRGWITAKVQTQEELNIVMPWIKISYELNRPGRKRPLKRIKARGRRKSTC